jgi:hypothetical protein
MQHYKVEAMTKELEQKLADRFPGWFDLKGDPRETLMCFGFTHGDGWFDLVWRLCEQIEPLVQRMEPPFEAFQVKEKFAGLRFYTGNTGNPAVHELISAAQSASFHICELCGQPGKRRSGRWIRTLCDEHAPTLKGYTAEVDAVALMTREDEEEPS